MSGPTLTRAMFWNKVESTINRTQVPHATVKRTILKQTPKDLGIPSFADYINDVSSEDFYKDRYRTTFMLMKGEIIDFIAYAGNIGDNYLLVHETCNINPKNALYNGLVHQETDLFMHTTLLTAKTLGNINAEQYDTVIDDSLLYSRDIDLLYNSQQIKTDRKYSTNLIGFRYTGNETNRYKSYSVFATPREELMVFRILSTIFNTATEEGLSVLVFADIAQKYPIDAFLYYLSQLSVIYHNVTHVIFLDSGKLSGLQLDQVSALTNYIPH